MAELTERFAQRDRERFAYLNRLIGAVNGEKRPRKANPRRARPGARERDYRCRKCNGQMKGLPR